MKMLGASEFWMLESTLFDSIMVDWKYEFFKKLMLYIDIGDILCISNSILTIWLWDYIKIKKIFQIVVFIYLKKEA